MKTSLITVALNQVVAIERTIRSVFDQSYDDIEYIIVDGGSTDGTDSVVRSWIPRFGNRLRFIQKEDNGVYEALNNGIKAATGDIVGILHADDIFTDRHVVAKVVEALEKDKSIDMVYGDIHFVSPDTPYHISRYYSAEGFRKEHLRLGFAPPHPSMYCRREVFEKYGLYREDYRVAADFEMFARLLWIPTVKSTYLPLDMVQMTTGGLSTRWRNRLFLNTFEKRRALRDNNIRSSYLLLLCRYLFNVPQYFKKSRLAVHPVVESKVPLAVEHSKKESDEVSVMQRGITAIILPVKKPEFAKYESAI